MKRIDSVNARPDVNGAGKAGFHANDDVPAKMQLISLQIFSIPYKKNWQTYLSLEVLL